MKQLDILFVRPNSKIQNYGELEQRGLPAIEPPLWPALLAGYCREKGLGIDIIDAEAEGYSPKILANTILDKNPKKVIINVCGHNPSASTQSMVGAKALMDILDEMLYHSDSDIEHIIFHGLHPSAIPTDALKIGADSVIVGEGFDIVDNLMGTELLPILLSQKLASLHTLPQPAWDLLPLHKYRAHNWHCFGHINERSPYGLVYTSLGCPRNCSFCVIHTMTNNERKWRARSPQQVIDDIDFWVSKGTTNIRIVDEDFSLNWKHTQTISNLIAAKYGDSLNIWAYASPATITREMLQVMRRAGIKWLCYGFESANLTEKGHDWLERIDIVAMDTKLADININANWIFGLPNDNFWAMQETLHLAQNINAEWSNFYCAMAYPGSKLYEEAVNNGWELPPTWEAYSQYSSETLPLPTKYLTAKEVLSFRDYAFKTYYSNPLYLKLIEDKFGQETVNHIKDILKVDIKRRSYGRL